MAEVRAPRGEEWASAVEALHGLANALAVRSHYPEGHPAIVRADEGAATGFARLLAQLPELVVAFVDGEVVVCERPMPELRERLAVVTEAMTRHEVECIVFQHGVTDRECTVLAKTLAAKARAPGSAREQGNERLAHILLRYAELQLSGDDRRRGTTAPYFVPDVEALLSDVARAAASDDPLDPVPAQTLAGRIVDSCAVRAFALVQRCVVPGEDDGAAHAANVATTVAAMALEARLATATCVDVTAAALLHDVGLLLMPPELRGVPAPLLDEASQAVLQNHCFVGARLLLAAGCPPLWISAALEHHRGVDGLGYPALSSHDPPHELVRWIALASFLDDKCTRIVMREDVPVCSPDEALRLAQRLANRYFAPTDLQLFQRALGPVPPGTTVELSDRRVAVVRQSSADPWRPQVELLTGPDALKRVDLGTIDVVEDRHRLSIVRAIPPPLLFPQAVVVAAPAPAPSPPPPPAVEPPPPARPRVASFVFRRPSEVPSTTVPVALEAQAAMSSRPLPLTSSAPPQAFTADAAVHGAEMERVYLERLGGLDRVPVLRLGTAQLAGLGLDRRATFVLSLCDGATSIEALIDLSGVPRIEVLRLLDELVRSGAVALG